MKLVVETVVLESVDIALGHQFLLLINHLLEVTLQLNVLHIIIISN